MRKPGPYSQGWNRFRSAWSRNDGKPREDWEPGVDLKESVLIGALVVVVVAMAIGVLSYA